MISWLSFMAVFLTFLHSCVHDEMSSASNPDSKEYTHKSLWNEDEKYIKNVMKIYFDNESEIRKTSGVPLWDYATTVGSFDESFLMVPVAYQEKIISVVKVPRHGNKVYFYHTDFEEEIAFFQGLVFAVKKKAVYPGEESKTTLCTRQWISIWIPDNPENENGDGHWETKSVVRCEPEEKDECIGIVNENGECTQSGSGNDGGYGYPGGGGGSEEEEPEEPCEKTKNMMNNPKMQPGLQELKNQSALGGEKGIKFKADGTPSAIISGGSHSVNLGDKTGYQGGYHNHTPTGIPMFSPPDIDQLLGFAKAQPTSDPANVNNAYMGMVAPNGMHYIIWFNGTYQDAITTYSQLQMDNYVIDYRKLEKELTDFAKNGTTYVDSTGSINNLGVEKLFFETLKNMGLQGKIDLKRIENDGTVQNINLDHNNMPVSVPCNN